MQIERLYRMIKNARIVRLNGQMAITKGIGTGIKNNRSLSRHLRIDVSDEPHGWLFFEEETISKARIAGNTVELKSDDGENYTLCLDPWRQKSAAAEALSVN